jgi:hypothetical protein
MRLIIQFKRPRFVLSHKVNHHHSNAGTLTLLWQLLTDIQVLNVETIT